MLIEKFEYKPIDRVTINGKRHYATPDGNKLPSVTTILDRTKPQEKIDALNNWRNRVGHDKAQQITTEAAGVGTSLHKHLENYLIAEHKQIGNNMVHTQAFKMSNIIIDNALSEVTEVWGVEVPLYFPGLYAGTTDLVGVYKGRPAIMDFKQTNRPKKEEYVEDYYLQLMAYILAHNEIHGTDINEGHIFMCSRDLQYQQFDLLPNNFNKWQDAWLIRVEQFYQL